MPLIIHSKPGNPLPAFSVIYIFSTSPLRNHPLLTSLLFAFSSPPVFEPAISLTPTFTYTRYQSFFSPSITHSAPSCISNLGSYSPPGPYRTWHFVVTTPQVIPSSRYILIPRDASTIS